MTNIFNFFYYFFGKFFCLSVLKNPIQTKCVITLMIMMMIAIFIIGTVVVVAVILLNTVNLREKTHWGFTVPSLVHLCVNDSALHKLNRYTVYSLDFVGQVVLVVSLPLHQERGEEEEEQDEANHGAHCGTHNHSHVGG